MIISVAIICHFYFKKKNVMTLEKQSCDVFIGAAQYVLQQRNNYEVRTHKTNFFYKISLQNLSLLDNE